MNSGRTFHTILYALVALVAAFAAGAWSIYMLRWTSIPLALVCVGICVYCVLAGRVMLLAASRRSPGSGGFGHGARVIAVLFALLAPIYALCQLMDFLAVDWQLSWKIPSGLRTALRFPDAVVDGAADFARAVWESFAGKPTASGGRMNVPDPDAPSILASIGQWIASAAWEIGISVVGGIVSTYLLASSRRQRS